MPRSSYKLSTSDFLPLYHAPNSHPKSNELFFTHPERAEMTLALPQIQEQISAVAYAINRKRGYIYFPEDIVTDVTPKILKEIVNKKGLSIEPSYLECPNRLNGYFKQYVAWRIQDMLSKNPYWKAKSTHCKPQDTDSICRTHNSEEDCSHKTTLEFIKQLTDSLINAPKTPVSPLNRLKYMMLYSPDLVDLATIQKAAQKQNSQLATPQAIWSAWQKHRSTYDMIRAQDHKDLKNLRRFCAWILFKPHLQSLAQFEALPEAKTLKENRFNRPVNRTFRSIIDQCIIHVLIHIEIDFAEKIVIRLLRDRHIKRQPKESKSAFQKRARRYTSLVSQQVYAWFDKFAKNPKSSSSVEAIATLLKGPNVQAPSSLSELEYIEQSVKRCISN